MVDMDRKVVETLTRADDASYFKGAFTDRSPPANVALGVGDVIRITIFEAGAGGLFSPVGSNNPGGGNFVTLPDQEVDQTGRISVPYADKNGDTGLINVVGKQAIEVQHDIQQRLMNKAIEPQVLVTLVKRSSNQFSVIGDVNAPGRFSLNQSGVRVLEALSTAGGPKSNDYNTLITLQRGTTSATARLSTLLRQAENNIFVQPSDLIAVKKEERYYNVLGATKSNNRVPFEAENVTVADAIAKAGGLNSEVAEPEAVIILRREDPKTLAALSINPEGQPLGEPVATVYRFNLSEPSGMFLAQRMQLRNNDVVYVSNHPFSDVSKLLTVVRDILLIRLINN
jgi:polysaccharide export outer membrane protein